jgi:hypothetical protein
MVGLNRLEKRVSGRPHYGIETFDRGAINASCGNLAG